MINFALIVARNKNNIIGEDGTIPWHCPEDLHHFKETTGYSAMIMGRKTHESLPESMDLVIDMY
jgi:dihydrofolate reductase